MFTLKVAIPEASEMPNSHWDPVDEGIDPALLPHISPIGWDNVILYGKYSLDHGWVRHPHGIPQHRVENFA